MDRSPFICGMMKPLCSTLGRSIPPPMECCGSSSPWTASTSSKAEPVLGYIHRMHEKLAEAGSFAQFMPNTARMDYLHALAFNHGWALVVEKAAGIEVPERAEYIRVITVELKPQSPVICCGGPLFCLISVDSRPSCTPFDDREKIIDLLERVTGSRLTYCYMRFGGVYNDIDDEFIAGTRDFIKRLRGRMPQPVSRFGHPQHHPDQANQGHWLHHPGAVPSLRRHRPGGPRGPASITTSARTSPIRSIRSLISTCRSLTKCDSMARYMVRMHEMEQSLRIN